MQVYETKALLYILHYIFCLHVLRMHHGYFFQNGFEIVRVPFLLRNINKNWCYLYFIRPITIYLSQLFLYVHYSILRCLEYRFCQINKLESFVSSNTFLFYAESKKKALLEFFFLGSLYVLICNFFF